MTLYLYELKSGWKSMLVWIVCIVGFLIFSMSLFPSFSENIEATEEMLANFSPEMLRALGMDVINFAKPMEYLAYMYQYLLVAVGAFAILMGGAIISKEEDDKTIEFLYAKPISRIYLVCSKISAAVTKLFIVAFSFYLSTLVAMILVANKVEHAAIINVSIGLLLFMLFFLSIGFLLGHFIIKASKRMPIALGFLFLLYLASIIADINEKLEVLRFITPFKYFNGIELVIKGFSLNYIVISVCIIMLATLCTGWLYQKKDLNT